MLVTFKRSFWLVLSAGLLLQGCVIHSPPKPGDPYYSPVIITGEASPPPSAGSLYREGMSLSLYGDRKAHRIGDVITIALQEQTISSKSSSTSVSKESDMSFNEGSLLGTNPTFKNLSLLTDLQQARDFEGEAESDQSNRLQGTVTVTVADILPNGNLVVRGEKWITLNKGDEFIRVSGIVRPEDIDTRNTVPSTKLANAHIAYSGTGALADSQDMGWLSRVFNTVFWPF